MEVRHNATFVRSARLASPKRQIIILVTIDVTEFLHVCSLSFSRSICFSGFRSARTHIRMTHASSNRIHRPPIALTTQSTSIRQIYAAVQTLAICVYINEIHGGMKRCEESEREQRTQKNPVNG